MEGSNFVFNFTMLMLKSFFLIIMKGGGNVGCLFVHCEYVFVLFFSKHPALTNGRTEYN